MAKHVADVANADPADIGVLLLERLRDRATCFGDDHKRALDDVLGAPVRGKPFESQLSVSSAMRAMATSMSSTAMRGSRAIRDLDGFPFDLIAQPRMKAIARRQVDRSLQAVLQDRLDVNQVKRIEPGRRLGFDEYIHVAAGAGCVP